MASNNVFILCVVFLGIIAFTEAISRRSLGVELHCRCILTESKPIGRFIQKVEMIAPTSHCKDTEIIATLKNTGQEVCLNPEAPWVKRVIQKILSTRKNDRHTPKSILRD